MSTEAQSLRNLQKKRRYRYAVGYVIEQEGKEPVERLVRDGTMSRFGVRQEWVPATDLEDLTRTEAEELLREREWQFYNYDKIDGLTIPTKIFDTHILFSPDTAIGEAESALEAAGFEVPETSTLDFHTRNTIEEIDAQDFFPLYIERLETIVETQFGGRSSLLRRVQRQPHRNVDASDTSL